MNADLERQLDEMGPEYRAIAAKIVGAFDCDAARTLRPPPARRRSAPWLAIGLSAAAAVALFLCLGLLFRGGEGDKVYTVRVADAGAEYLLAHIRGDEAVKELIRTQRPDGSWGSDFLTRQNARALKRSGAPEAQIAYKKAMRNLKSRGISL